MTVLPVSPAAVPVPTAGAAGGCSDPADFLAAILQALTAQDPAATAQNDDPTADPAVDPTQVVAQPGLHLGVDHVGHPVNPKHLEPTEPTEPPQPPGDVTAPPVNQPPTDQAPVAQAPVPQALVPPAPVTAPRAGNPGLHHPVSPGQVEPTAPQRPVSDTTPPDQPKTELPKTEQPKTELPKTEVQPTTAAPVPTSPTVATNPAPTVTPIAVLVSTAPAAAAPPSVPDQVFGEITGLTSRGNGTHRITMKLQPEALGEIRVVLTVRDGAVHVRIAGGQQAHAALLEGAPELDRLLQHAGASETRVVVREFSAAAATSTQLPTPASTPAANQAPTADAANPVSSGLTGDRSPDRHAGTRADHLATDGDDHPRGHRTGGLRDVTPIRSDGGARSAVDLTM